MKFFVATILVAGVVLIVSLIFKSRFPIRVTVTSEGVKRAKGISQAASRRLGQICAEILPTGKQLTLRGYFTDEKTIRWIIPKNVDQQFAQRLRNILTNESVLS